MLLSHKDVELLWKDFQKTGSCTKKSVLEHHGDQFKSKTLLQTVTVAGNAGKIYSNNALKIFIEFVKYIQYSVITCWVVFHRNTIWSNLYSTQQGVYIAYWSHAGIEGQTVEILRGQFRRREALEELQIWGHHSILQYSCWLGWLPAERVRPQLWLRFMFRDHKVCDVTIKIKKILKNVRKFWKPHSCNSSLVPLDVQLQWTA